MDLTRVKPLNMQGLLMDLDQILRTERHQNYETGGAFLWLLKLKGSLHILSLLVLP